MTELPPMPESERFYYSADDHRTVRKPLSLFTADQMRAYAEAAIKQEREACLAAIDDIEEKPWHGYENPNTFQDAKWAAMEALRARSEDREGS